MRTFIIAISYLLAVGCSAPVGQPGPTGQPGPVGPKGDTGERGEKGDTGKQGANGTNGMDGKPGANGKDGADASDGSKIAAGIYCVGGLEGSTNLTFTYQAIEFENGNVFVTGSIRDGSVETSASNFYAPTQNGWVNGGVLVQHDAYATDNAGFWNLTLNRQTLVVSISYYDSQMVGGGATWTMTPNKCTVSTY